MAGYAKKAIRDSFIKLLNEKPLSQITIRDIVEDCDVNRNTFYYYFQGLPQLVETIVDEAAQRMIREYPAIESIEECLDAIIGFALENRKAVLHIYQSINRDIFEQYLWRVCQHAVTTYIDGVFDGRIVPESDRKLIVDYWKCVCFGLAIGWLERGMQDDIRARFHRMHELKQGDLERMIARYEKHL